MNPEECEKNTIAFLQAYKFPNGNIKPKFFILLDDAEEKTDTIIVATFTTNLRFRDRKSSIFIPKGYFKDYVNEPFPYEDCLLDCNTCNEIPAKVIRSGHCKFVGCAPDIWMPKIYKALKYATRIEPKIILRLKRRLNLH